MGVHRGFADLMVLCEGRVLFLELKSPTGRLSPAQAAFRDAVQAQGFGWALVRSSTTRWARWRTMGSPRVSRPRPSEASAMSHEATNWAIKQRGLKPTTKIVLWHLCDRFNPDYGCFPSQERLAHDCEIGRAHAERHLDQLEAAGLLIRRIRVIRCQDQAADAPPAIILGFEPDFAQIPRSRVRTAGHGDQDLAEIHSRFEQRGNAENARRCNDLPCLNRRQTRVSIWRHGAVSRF